MAGPGAAAAYAALPAPVRSCLSAAGPAFRAAARRDPAGFPGEIKKLLGSASAALGCAPADALFLTGFRPGDTTPGRLEAALAELRAAEFLASEGFARIEPVARAAGKTADLAASRGGTRYVFEVRWVSAGFGPGLVKRLSAKCRKKSVQVGASSKRSGAAKGAIVFVAGPPYGSGGGRLPGLAAAAEAVSALCPGLRVCLVSAAGSAVHPPWG